MTTDSMHAASPWWCAAAFVIALLALPPLALPQTSATPVPRAHEQVEQLQEQAKSAVDARRWPEATALLEELLQLTPSVPEIHANLGMAYYSQGRPAQALASFRRALKLRPQMPQVGLMVGICQAELGRNVEAIAVLEPAFRKASGAEIDHLVGLRLLQAFAALKQYDKAAAVGEALLKRYPDDAEILFEVSRLYADRSYDLMSDLKRSDPDSAWVHYANAQVQESLQKYDVARQEYQSALERQPDMPGLHYRLGRMTLLEATPTAESLAAASRLFEQELAISPRNPDAEYELGEINREQGKYESALDHFSRAVAQQPDFIEARLGCGETLLSLGQAAQAVPQLKEAARLDPENKAPHALLARAYRVLGDSVAATAEADVLRKLDQAGQTARVPIAAASAAQKIAR